MIEYKCSFVTTRIGAEATSCMLESTSVAMQER